MQAIEDKSKKHYTHNSAINRIPQEAEEISTSKTWDICSESLEIESQREISLREKSSMIAIKFAQVNLNLIWRGGKPFYQDLSSQLKLPKLMQTDLDDTALNQEQILITSSKEE